MPPPVIRVENLSKLYRLGETGTGSLAHDVNRWWHRIRGREDPYTRVGQVNDRTKKTETDWVYALKDINFEVRQGEVLGIIGRNGAGKSTLLKILSRVTAPSSGEVKVKGRIASLLEVGTGFHPDLTGRENIYLNGAVLGMRKKEIDGKLDEIVDFSGCSAYMDTPVKRYSSGMQIRLAFAVAAHLEPEILIVDEVLAVGDAEFQRKCIGRMSEVAGQGRTVLFVSHNLTTIRTLTQNCVVLDQGRIICRADTANALQVYEGRTEPPDRVWMRSVEAGAPLTIRRVYLSNEKNAVSNRIALSQDWTIHIEYSICEPLASTVLECWIYAADGTFLCLLGDYDTNEEWLVKREPGNYSLQMKVSPNFLNTGEYSLRINACRSGIDVFAHFEALRFVVELDVPGRHQNKGLGLVSPRTFSMVQKSESLPVLE